MDKSKKVVILIPCLDEEKNIGETIDRLLQTFSHSKTLAQGYEVELLVINDGSSDKTEERVKERGVKIISHPGNLGVGAAIRSGIEDAYENGADAAVTFYADPSYDPAELEKFIEALLADKADICFGSRFSGKENANVIRSFRNTFFTFLLNQLTRYRVSDSETGVMGISRRYMEDFEIWDSHIPAQQILIDGNFKHMRFVELPISYDLSSKDSSGFRSRSSFHIFLGILWVLINANPLKVFSGLGSLLILFSALYFFLSIYAQKYQWENSFIFIRNLSIASLLVGLQAFIFGFLADLVKRK